MSTMCEEPIWTLPNSGGRNSIRGIIIEKDGELRQAANKDAVFNFSVQNRDGETVRAVAFDQVAEAIFDFIQIGKTYWFTDVDIMDLDDIFNDTEFEFQLVIRDPNEIVPCDEDKALVLPERTCPIEPIKLAEAMELAEMDRCDILGVITKVGPLRQVDSRNHQRWYELRELSLLDDSGTTVDLTVWEDDARDFNARDIGIVLRAHNCLWKTYRCTKYFTLYWGRYEKSPETQEATELLAWYKNSGGSIHPH